MDATTDPNRAAVLMTLRGFAHGMNEEQADGVLDLILKGWGFGDCTQLQAALAVLEVPGVIGHAALLFWLHATLLVSANPNGRHLIVTYARTCALADAPTGRPN